MLINHFIKYLLLLLSGGLLFVQVYNRIILHMKHGRFKSFVSVLALGGIVLAPPIGHWISPYHNMVFRIVSILFLFLILLELFQKIHRLSLSKSVPIEEHCRPNHIKTCMLTDTSHTIVIRRFKPQVSRFLGGSIRIAHISDLHVNNNPSDHFFKEVFSVLMETNPDVVFITGDFSDNSNCLYRLIPFLQQIQPTLGKFGVLGNHDFWGNHHEIRCELQSAGIVFPSSEGLEICHSRSQKIIIYGIEYPHLKPWPFKLNTLDPGAFNIALSHTPDNFFRLAKSNFDMIFSGHLHGGQWRFPFIGSVVSPSIFDRLFDQGHFQKHQTHMFVTSGIGNVWIPKRINCCPEILLVDLSPDCESCGFET